MARHHMTADGPVPFTAQEEADRDAEEAAFISQRDARVPPVTTAAKLDALTAAVHALATGKPAPAEAVELLDRVRKK